MNYAYWVNIGQIVFQSIFRQTRVKYLDNPDTLKQFFDFDTLELTIEITSYYLTVETTYLQLSLFSNELYKIFLPRVSTFCLFSLTQILTQYTVNLTLVPYKIILFPFPYTCVYIEVLSIWQFTCMQNNFHILKFGHGNEPYIEEKIIV